MTLPEMDWGSVADWASAAGSILASGVALYLAADANRVKASVDCSVSPGFCRHSMTASGRLQPLVTGSFRPKTDIYSTYNQRFTRLQYCSKSLPKRPARARSSGSIWKRFKYSTKPSTPSSAGGQAR